MNDAIKPDSKFAIYREALRLEDKVREFRERIEKALTVAHSGTTDGDWHKMWVIDQMVRALAGPEYDDWVRRHKDGEDGPETYGWDEGIAP